MPGTHPSLLPKGGEAPPRASAFSRWPKRIGCLARWACAALLLLLIVATHTPIGIRKVGHQIGFCDGSFFYQSQRRFRTPPPSAWVLQSPNRYEFHYSRLGDFDGLHFSRTRLWTELVLPLWLPLVGLLPLTVMARRRRTPSPPGPYRMTLWRYAKGAAVYAIVASAVSAIALALIPTSGYGRYQECFIPIFLLLTWAAFPLGGFLAAKQQIAKANRRFPSGFCRTCRYDLTGNVSGVCPECGTKIQRP